MRFRPCIDLRHGRVTQIVGSTLQSTGPASARASAASSDTAQENFVSERPSSYFAQLYASHSLYGGHVIMLGPGNDEAARLALSTFPRGLQIGGGIDEHNALTWLDAGASHVIVTSWLFPSDSLDLERLNQLSRLVGREHLVIDLSCRRRSHDGPYYVVTNRWQTFTSFQVSPSSLRMLSPYCAEFLVHGVDVEGKRMGVEHELLTLLARAGEDTEQPCNPIVYAGGVRDMADIRTVEQLGCGRIDVSVGSALDIFGGSLAFSELVAHCSGDR